MVLWYNVQVGDPTGAQLEISFARGRPAGLAVWSVRFKASRESLFRTAVDGSASYVRVAAPGVRRRYVCGRVLQAI